MYSGYRLGYCFLGGVAWGRGNRWSSTDFSVMHHLLQFNASCNSNSVLYNGRMKLSTACNSLHPLTPPSTLPHNLTPPTRPSPNLPSPSPWIMFWVEGYSFSGGVACGRGYRWSSTDFSVMLQFNASCNSNSVLYNRRMKLSTTCNSPHPLTPPSTLLHNLTPPP